MAGIVISAIVALTLLSALFIYINKKKLSGLDKGGTIVLPHKLEGLYLAHCKAKI